MNNAATSRLALLPGPGVLTHLCTVCAPLTRQPHVALYHKEKEAQRDRDKGCNGQTCVGFRSHAKPEVRGIHQGEDENDDEAGDLGERDQRQRQRKQDHDDAGEQRGTYRRIRLW